MSEMYLELTHAQSTAVILFTSRGEVLNVNVIV